MGWALTVRVDGAFRTRIGSSRYRPWPPPNGRRRWPGASGPTLQGLYNHQGTAVSGDSVDSTDETAAQALELAAPWRRGGAGGDREGQR